jgi:hypothetical protein
MLAVPSSDFHLLWFLYELAPVWIEMFGSGPQTIHVFSAHSSA